MLNGKCTILYKKKIQDILDNVVKLTNAEIGWETLQILTPVMCICSMLNICLFNP